MNENIILAMMLVLLVFVVASIIIGIINQSKINAIYDYSEDGNLAENLKLYYDGVRDLQKKLKMSNEGSISERLSNCETRVNMTLSKTGIVNFNAFDDVHGNQSFALAVLNQYNDGFIITSLYGSSSSNTYVRTVKEGKSSTTLLNEEKEAIKLAMTGKIS